MDKQVNLLDNKSTYTYLLESENRLQNSSPLVELYPLFNLNVSFRLLHTIPEYYFLRFMGPTIDLPMALFPLIYDAVRLNVRSLIIELRGYLSQSLPLLSNIIDSVEKWPKPKTNQV